MTRFALTVEFDGTPFMGLQRQPQGMTVQQAIEDAAFAITGERTQLFSAGRTDAGVHALAMRCHIDIAKPMRAFRLMEALNATLRPHPIAINACEVVPDDWHARFSCVARRYRYLIRNRRAPLTIGWDREWQVKSRLDVAAMQDAAKVLIGRHDFTTFRSTKCQAPDPVKTLDRLDIRAEGDRIVAEVAARSFLHHQVRSMVGCLALVGTGKWNADRLQSALSARDRNELGLNAPPHGLYFVAAIYSDQENEL